MILRETERDREGEGGERERERKRQYMYRFRERAAGKLRQKAADEILISGGKMLRSQRPREGNAARTAVEKILTERFQLKDNL